jgi:hypothetical protein
MALELGMDEDKMAEFDAMMDSKYSHDWRGIAQAERRRLEVERLDAAALRAIHKAEAEYNESIFGD